MGNDKDFDSRLQSKENMLMIIGIIVNASAVPLCEGEGSTYLKPVTTLQKRIARITTFSEPVSHSEPLLKSLNLLKFNDIIHSEILSFVYQWFHKLVPSCFLDFFKPISSIHEYPTRQSLNENLL